MCSRAHTNKQRKIVPCRKQSAATAVLIPLPTVRTREKYPTLEVDANFPDANTKDQAAGQKQKLIAGRTDGHYVSVNTEWRQTSLLNVDRSADDCNHFAALPSFLRERLDRPTWRFLLRYGVGRTLFHEPTVRITVSCLSFFFLPSPHYFFVFSLPSFSYNQLGGTCLAKLLDKNKFTRFFYSFAKAYFTKGSITSAMLTVITHFLTTSYN